LHAASALYSGGLTRVRVKTRSEVPVDDRSEARQMLMPGFPPVAQH